MEDHETHEPTTLHSFSFTAEPMIPAARLPWWQWLWRKLLHRPMPKPIQPDGTRPLVIETTTPGGQRQRIYIPAARLDDGTQGRA